jgi:hypothetical protein
MIAAGRAYAPKRSFAASVIKLVVPITPASINTQPRSPAAGNPKNVTLTIAKRRYARSTAIWWVPSSAAFPLGSSDHARELTGIWAGIRHASFPPLVRWCLTPHCHPCSLRFEKLRSGQIDSSMLDGVIRSKQIEATLTLHSRLLCSRALSEISLFPPKQAAPNFD